MVELHEQIRRDMEILRERASPPPGADARVLAAVEAIGFGPSPLEPDPAANDALGHAAHAGHGTAQLVWAAKIVAVTLALTGAGLLGIGVTAKAIRAIRSSDGPSHVEVTAPSIASADTGPERIPVPAPLTEPKATEPAAIQPKASVPRPPPAAEIQAPDPLAAELALIEAARTAKDAGDALELLYQHERGFADGLLATERELLIIEHLCELDQFEPARTRDRRMFADRRDAPQRARLLELCPELAED